MQEQRTTDQKVGEGDGKLAKGVEVEGVEPVPAGDTKASNGGGNGVDGSVKVDESVKVETCEDGEASVEVEDGTKETNSKEEGEDANNDISSTSG